MIAAKRKKSCENIPFTTNITLHWERGNEIVTVTPENKEQFYLTVENAVNACKAYKTNAKFYYQFNKLLQRLAIWIREHDSNVGMAFLTIRDAGLLFLINRTSIKYDREFEDSLTDLDIEVAHDKNFNTIKMSVLALPKSNKEAILSFLNPKASICYAK